MIKSDIIRKQFIDFFIKKNHKQIRSSSVVPIDDPTLLFTNAGMNQFKPIFLDKEIPKNKRLVNSQKCIRVSGKHNDLEEVGVDDYHHTFFEMLGNWSFGDYYKEEAVVWAWELLTKVWKIDKKRLWVSVYEEDKETKEIWLSKTDIDENRVLNFGKKENFWEMGETGPCGPCTEIHYFFGDDLNKQSSEGVNVHDNYREIWNLVFIQYNRDKNGSLIDLPQKHVDTGMGLERIVGVLNNEISNYRTDLFQKIIIEIEKLTGIKYYDDERGIPHRVIADHIRMLSFSIADGAMPSNEGRGYVLRRVLRRAARFCRTLNAKNEILYKLVDSVVNLMKDPYKELQDKKIHIENVIKAEEESFCKTLDKGLDVFEQIINISNLKKYENLIISGKDAFKLYDTYGFPLDLTKLLAKEKNISVDENGFNKFMDIQKERSRKGSDFKVFENEIKWKSDATNNASYFIGYSNISTETKILNYRKIDADYYEVILENTPFYAESGGQIGDTGYIKNNKIYFEVKDTQKNDNCISHLGFLKKGNFKLKDKVEAAVDNEKRLQIRANHTATHLLHESLKQILGNHVQQAGSLVSSEKLRFDLTHYEKISNKEISKIENLVNSIIRKNIELSTSIQQFDQARANGATALFGEKYDDQVRVVDIPGFSMELCGGTHVSRTGDIGLFKIISESSLSSGVRRIEALTGQEALNRIINIEQILNQSKSILKTTENDLNDKVLNLINSNKNLEKKIKSGISNTNLNFSKLNEGSKKINQTSIIFHDIKDFNGDLKQIGDSFRQNSISNSIFILSSYVKDKINVMCALSDDLVSSYNAGDIAKAIGKLIDGGGGGKKHIATAGGKNIIKSDELFKKIFDHLKKELR